MTRFGVRLLVALASLALALTGCGKVGSGGGQSAQPSSTDNRPVKAGGTMRVALDAEADKLDPTTSRTLVGRIVMASMCQTLYDINEKLEIVPLLAAALPDVSADGKTVKIKIRTGLRFADGTVMDANAVKTSLDRNRTMPGSQRRSELSPVTEVVVTDPATVELHLAAPYAPLASQLVDRAGMVMSPAALAKGGDFGTAPVCIGPFKYLTRVAQDRIEVVKDPNYYDAAKVKLDKIIYKTITDANTRFTNLRSGDVDVIFNVSPINVDELKGISNLHLISTESLGYQGITVNVGNSAGLGKDPGPLAAPYAGPLATDARVRKALSLSIDRESLNRTVFRGVFAPACGPISPASPLASDASQSCPKHDVAEAKRLLQEAGVPNPKVSLTVVNNADGKRVGEAIKSMAAEAGFDIQIEPTEFASALDMVDAGRYQMFRIGWSGQVDADGNITRFFQTKGSTNDSGYSNPQVDQWLDEARGTLDTAKRRDLYGKVIKQIQEDNPIIYLYRQKDLIATTDKVGQVKMYSDYIIRLDTAGFVE